MYDMLQRLVLRVPGGEIPLATVEVKPIFRESVLIYPPVPTSAAVELIEDPDEWVPIPPPPQALVRFHGELVEQAEIDTLLEGFRIIGLYKEEGDGVTVTGARYSLDHDFIQQKYLKHDDTLEITFKIVRSIKGGDQDGRKTQ